MGTRRFHPYVKHPSHLNFRRYARTDKDCQIASWLVSFYSHADQPERWTHAHHSINTPCTANCRCRLITPQFCVLHIGRNRPKIWPKSKRRMFDAGSDLCGVGRSNMIANADSRYGRLACDRLFCATSQLLSATQQRPGPTMWRQPE